MTASIATFGLRKVYPPPGRRRRASQAKAARNASAGENGDLVALDGLDLQVDSGEFFGLLGPNGAGKTTTLGILTTRVRPSSGSAFVAGVEVSEHPERVRERIGVVPQRPNPDRSLRVCENLLFHAAYFGVPRAIAARRADALLAQMELSAKAEATIEELSGGQQQRLMIARALIHEPEVLFLDEPTVGLDPQARLALWEILRELHGQGRTIVMTTHYMEEADQLCERVAIIDRGKLLALDTPATLKEQAPGGTLIELALDGPAIAAERGARELDGVTHASGIDSVLRVYSERGGELIPSLIRIVEASGRSVRDIQLLRPSLETLFISLTGRKLT